MTKKFLGEFDVNIADSSFKNYSPFDWAMYFIESYGQIDGSDHKQWVLDQVAQIYNGVEVTVKLAKWDDGHEEYRINLKESNDKYKIWVNDMCSGEDGDYTYSYDSGSAP
jgi:hypothetical protein